MVEPYEVAEFASRIICRFDILQRFYIADIMKVTIGSLQLETSNHIEMNEWHYLTGLDRGIGFTFG